MYGTLLESDQYFLNSGFDQWDNLTDAQKKSVLGRSSVILDALYGHRFPGQKENGLNQVEQWPRVNATTLRGEPIPEGLVPPAVKTAVYEIARIEVTRPGSIIPNTMTNQQVRKQKLDVLEREFFKGVDGNSRDSLPYLPIIEGILSDLVSDNLGLFPVFWVR